MKQSEKLDLILKGLYNFKYDGSYYSITSIMESFGSKPVVNEAFSLSKRLEGDGYIQILGSLNDALGCLTSQGIEYVEEDSYTYSGKAIVNNNYNISVVNSPNSNVVNHSTNVAITQDFISIRETLDKIRATIQVDSSIDAQKLEDILLCVQEIESSVEKGIKPKFATKSLLDIAGGIASIASGLTLLGQFVGLIPVPH